MAKIKSILLILFSTIYVSGYSQVVVNQQNGIFRICKGKIRDSEKGKTSTHYDHNEKIIMTLAMPGAKSITLSFKSFCTEKDNDILKIYDGKDTTKNLIGAYSGSVSPGNVSSTDSFITLLFMSDKSVSCTGWEADVINNIAIPSAAKISLVKSPICKDSLIDLTLDVAISCDSLNLTNTQIAGATIKSISALNCSGSKASKFRILLNGALLTNGNYTLTHKHGYRDFCDSIYILSSFQSFKITNCPILVDLTSLKDTICLGECLNLTVKANGGNASKYTYSWNIAGISGSNPLVCPKSTTKFKVVVNDGNAIPGSDSLTIVVLSPPVAQNDTQICYLSPNLFLKGYPAGGKWFGNGIVNSSTGEFKPYGQWGNVKLWYKIGSCTDTMVVNVTNPYNYDNVFCPGKTPLSVTWFGPLGGTWTGPKISPTGFFTPDSAGSYVVTYTWKGCTSKKNILVQNVVVPAVDTTCESRLLDTLQFKPYGIYPQYFTGLLNTYYGWFNPSLMGGPGTRNIIFTAIGGCKDTTKLTILPCFAGKDDTICPSKTNHVLINLRHNGSYSWVGKGIVNATSNAYDASWTNGADGIDTLKFTSGRCRDTKIVRIIGTAITGKDTQDFCYNSDTFILGNFFKTNVPNGTWSGLGVIGGRKFAPKNMTPGTYPVAYARNGCQDFGYVRVLGKPVVPKDTSVCEDSKPFTLIPNEKGGVFWGTGVKYGIKTEFSPQLSKPGTFIINYLTPIGCANSFKVTVDSLTPIQYLHPTKTFCFNDSPIVLKMNPMGGNYLIGGKLAPTFISSRYLPGTLNLKYMVMNKSCQLVDSFSLVVMDSIQLSLSPKSDSICKGETILLEAKATGGTGNYAFLWSNGQNGYKTFVSPIISTTYTCNVNDGCSNNESQLVNVFSFPKVWSRFEVSPPVCYGQTGFVKVTSGNGNPLKYIWNYPMKTNKDTFFGPSGGNYKVFLKDSQTACFSDTSIYIPGYSAIKALFGVQLPINGNCYTPEEYPIEVYNATIGASSGSWLIDNQLYDSFKYGQNIFIHNLDSKSKLNLKLAVSNLGGCSDTSEIDLCFKDTIILYIPTAFSPNGDKLNDEFIWKNYGASKISVSIYNRWGEIIYKSNDMNGSWDGKVNGVDCPEGLYIAYIEYRGNRVANKVFTQTLMLLRNIDK